MRGDASKGHAGQNYATAHGDGAGDVAQLLSGRRSLRAAALACRISRDGEVRDYRDAQSRKKAADQLHRGTQAPALSPRTTPSALIPLLFAQSPSAPRNCP